MSLRPIWDRVADAGRYRWLNREASFDQLCLLMADTPRDHWAEQIDQWRKVNSTLNTRKHSDGSTNQQDALGASPGKDPGSSPHPAVE